VNTRPESSGLHRLDWKPTSLDERVSLRDQLTNMKALKGMAGDSRVYDGATSQDDEYQLSGTIQDGVALNLWDEL